MNIDVRDPPTLNRDFLNGVNDPPNAKQSPNHLYWQLWLLSWSIQNTPHNVVSKSQLELTHTTSSATTCKQLDRSFLG